MSLGIARKSSKNWSGFFCVLDAFLGRRRSIFVVFVVVTVVFLEKENMYYAAQAHPIYVQTQINNLYCISNRVLHFTVE